MVPSLIKVARRKKKISQEQLGFALGVNRATVSKYECGIITPSVEQAQKISAFLDIPFLDLVGIEPEDNNEEERIKLEKLIVEHLNKDKSFDLNKLLDIYFYDERGLRFKSDNEMFAELIDIYDGLSNEGQQKVIDYARDLAKIDLYKRLTEKADEGEDRSIGRGVNAVDQEERK